MSIFPITKSAANKMRDPGFRSVEEMKVLGLKELDLKELEPKDVKTWFVCIITVDDRSLVCVIATKFRKKCD